LQKYAPRFTDLAVGFGQNTIITSLCFANFAQLSHRNPKKGFQKRENRTVLQRMISRKQTNGRAKKSRAASQLQYG
jgi:hypothetical protein